MKSLQKKVIAFRDARDWKQFHNQKDMALSLALEAAEVLEHFQWKATKADIDKYVKAHKKEIGEELVDVLYWVLAMSHDLGVDLEKAFEKKMEKNGRKYPVKKVKGRSTKYNKL
ncbi:nucleotide pyrophosphohydrolase [Candidatus Kaiserbacteria bacterium CG10_big_fil_rev_8_21_14_0_10_51_14]|uniref:Nucleotide pyrophosphohydrolase n=1 Tax=Candidatus Kaiserbacteria bacterium CG10_big_fil_rev_8_21_14_0_10_51_14 TaxID=1974610 RepID=A0A2H0UCI6_9BACT|nr:MAG: nucleotide pyrophosphohydrolase [Candidatus Kaiserbacteria bacterium CG10_big_fil_rev_8_21_14_0_10_51_14]